jgi:hypothetical protein
MKGLVVFRWLMPVALAVFSSVPVQSVNAHGMGGGGGHMGGGMGGGHMGGMGGGGRPMMGTRFFGRNGMSSFAQRHDPAFGTRFVNRGDRFFDRRDLFRDSRGLPDRFANRQDRFADRRGRFGNERFEGGREGRFEHGEHFENEHHEGEEHEEHEHKFFENHNFFVGFDFGAFGWWPWWAGWDWWYPYPYYPYYPYYGYDYGYDYGYGYPYYGGGYGDPQTNGSQYGGEYWNNLAMSVQTKLAEQGYYHGQVDGVIGSGTMEGVRRFQSDHGLKVTGKIDPKLLRSLGISYKAPPRAQT